MSGEELKKMNAKELRARLAKIGELSEKAEGKDLEDLVKEATEINDLLQDAENRRRINAQIAKEETLLAGGAGSPGDHPGERSLDPRDKAREDRGKKLKDKTAVKYEARGAFRNVNNVLSSTQTVMPKHTAQDIKETFNDVSSLVDRVRIVQLNGGETYQRAFVKSYGDGAGHTAEGVDYNLTEPTFGYITIEREKITAYTEEPEEMIKLPDADYDSVVEGSVIKAIRRYMSRQILIGDGSTGKFKGIFHNSISDNDQVIDKKTDLEIEAVTAETLDDIIYSFGGEEEVEDIAVLILNKKDLRAFAKLKDKQGRKYYTIVNHGNTGTIDGVPYIINSACKAISDSSTESEAYCMAYGPMSNYEMAIFSDIDARRSTDYKFKQGQVAYRADIFAGGAVAARNGFIRVKKKAAGDV